MNDKKGARIYDFGTGRLAKPGTVVPTERVPAEERPETNNVEGEVKDRHPAVAFLCAALFFVLFWIRPVVRFVLKVIGIPAGLAAPLVWLGLDAPNKTSIVLGLFALSFATFLVSWFYDSLLFWLSPEPVFLNS